MRCSILIPLKGGLMLAGALLALASENAAAQDGMKEARSLQTMAAKESGRPMYTPATGVKFKASDNVFLKSALEVNFTYRAAFATLPSFAACRRATSRSTTSSPTHPTSTSPAPWG